MTVAAVILIPDPARALADADGEPAIRRVAAAAWAGGALPLVAVLAPPAGADGADAVRRVAAAVADLSVTIAHPEASVPPGAAWFAHGLGVAAETVSETAAALLWPFRYTWVDPETITSLVEASGANPGAIVRPAFDGQPGFPILVPLETGRGFAANPEIHGWQAIEAAVAGGAPYRLLELGDPGIVADMATPRAELPPYQGPSEPAGGPAPEWNETLGTAAAQAEPLEGPSLAPYRQAREATREDDA